MKEEKNYRCTLVVDNFRLNVLCVVIASMSCLVCCHCIHVNVIGKRVAGRE
jgi:hypothetical protein